MTNNIKKLSDYSHLRKRTNMYLGSVDPHTQSIVLYDDKRPFVEEVTWVPALFTCFREIMDNALDEIVGHGFGNRIDVEYDEANLLFSIRDNGRGIPIDFDKTHKQYLATMVLTEPRAGRNFDDRGEVAGVNGIGSAAVSNTAEFFEVEIIRDGKKFKQIFREGLGDADALDITAPKITATKSDKTGTFIKFHPSKDVYKHRILPEKFLKSRVTEIAICNPTLKIYYNGELIKVKPRPEQNLFEGIRPITIEINEGNFRSKFWVTYGEGTEHIHTIVNNIPAFNGGVHVDAFRRLFYSGMLSALERESKRRKLSPNRSDIQDGLFIYNITNMSAPNFDSQSKTRLINEEVASVMKKSLEQPDLYRDLIKKNPEWIAAIYARCEARTMKKDASDLAKAAKANKRHKVKKLIDATGSDRRKCTIFLAEGDSAISGFTEARDPYLHGSLPLRGKVLNVHPSKTTLKEAANNDSLLQIMRAIGLSVGIKADRAKLRYGKVYITCDADEDGKNIMALLVNFFYQLWPELFDANDPFLYVFDTPLIIATKGKQKKYWFNDDYATFDQDQYKGWEITRAKGLAALRKPDWINMLAEPRATPITDDGGLREALDLLFNEKRPDARKEWMGV